MHTIFLNILNKLLEIRPDCTKIHQAYLPDAIDQRWIPDIKNHDIEDFTFTRSDQQAVMGIMLF
jgi:hypothetical protein